MTRRPFDLAAAQRAQSEIASRIRELQAEEAGRDEGREEGVGEGLDRARAEEAARRAVEKLAAKEKRAAAARKGHSNPNNPGTGHLAKARADREGRAGRLLDEDPDIKDAEILADLEGKGLGRGKNGWLRGFRAERKRSAAKIDGLRRK